MVTGKGFPANEISFRKRRRTSIAHTSLSTHSFSCPYSLINFSDYLLSHLNLPCLLASSDFFSLLSLKSYFPGLQSISSAPATNSSTAPPSRPLNRSSSTRAPPPPPAVALPPAGPRSNRVPAPYSTTNAPASSTALSSSTSSIPSRSFVAGADRITYGSSPAATPSSSLSRPKPTTEVAPLPPRGPASDSLNRRQSIDR